MPSTEGFSCRYRTSLPLHAFPLRPHSHTSAGSGTKRQDIESDLVRGAPSASGHLAQRELRVWAVPGRRALSFFRGSSTVRTGHESPRAPSSSSSYFLSFPELLLVDLVLVSCVWCLCFFSCSSPPGRCRLGVML